MKTHPITWLSLISIFSILLAACSPVTATLSTSAEAQTAAQLAAGLLKLEDTDQAVSAAQAAELLTLWQAYQALSASETAAAVELEAILAQIQAALTVEQSQAIAAMQLTTASIDALLPSQAPTLDSSAPSDAADNAAGGQMPSGGGPGGDAIMAELGAPEQGALSASTAESPAPSGASDLSNGVSPMLLNAVIRLLEAKIQTAESS